MPFSPSRAPARSYKKPTVVLLGELLEQADQLLDAVVGRLIPLLDQPKLDVSDAIAAAHRLLAVAVELRDALPAEGSQCLIT